MGERVLIEVLAGWCEAEAAKLMVSKPGNLAPGTVNENQAAGLGRAAEKAREYMAALNAIADEGGQGEG